MQKGVLTLFGIIGMMLIGSLSIIFSAFFPINTNEAGDQFTIKAIQHKCVEFKPASEESSKANGGIPVGVWTNLGCKKNVITNKGLNHTMFLLGKGSTSVFVTNVSAIALGNGSVPAVSDTSLPSEITGCGLSRAFGTYYDLGNGWWEVNTTMTFTGCGSGPVLTNSTGNYNATTGGTFFSGGTITQVTFTTDGDQIKIRHNFTYVEG